MIETSTIIEAIYYLLRKLKKADKIKLVKLIYLADKYHLIRYGRTITNDDYYAMEHGPVGATVKDVLSLDPFNIPPKTSKYLSTLIIKDDENHFRENPGAKINFDMLSDTDKEALDFVIEKFGRMGQWKLRDYTHKYPEWHKYKDLFENKLTRRERIETKELLSTLKDDPLSMPRKHVRESEKILTGNFD
ncbi:MAG: SocA family protein [Nitrospirae bacterium]|nr:SocA family protein [Nitrospirota bacterium]